MTSLEPQRSAGIDVLRGVCVLLVTLHHIHLRFRLNRFDVKALLPAPVAQVVFWSGYFAVIAFFVISGFLITNLSLRRWTSLDQLSWRQFYWLRFARIAPCDSGELFDAGFNSPANQFRTSSSWARRNSLTVRCFSMPGTQAEPRTTRIARDRRGR